MNKKRFVTNTLFFILIIILVSTTASATWWNTNCLNKRKIEIVNPTSSIIQNSTFTLQLNLSNYNFSNNDNILRIINSSETGIISHYKAYYNQASKTARLRFQTGTENLASNSNTTFFLYYNCSNLAETNNQSVDARTNLSLMLAFDDQETTQFNDTSGNGINPILQGCSGTTSGGIIANTTISTCKAKINQESYPLTTLRNLFDLAPNTPFGIEFWFNSTGLINFPGSSPQAIKWGEVNAPSSDGERGYIASFGRTSSSKYNLTGMVSAGIDGSTPSGINCAFNIQTTLNNSLDGTDWHHYYFWRNSSIATFSIDGTAYQASEGTTPNNCTRQPMNIFGSQGTNSITNITFFNASQDSRMDNFYWWHGSAGWNTYLERNLTQVISSEQSIKAVITQNSPLNNQVILFNNSGITFNYSLTISNNANITIYLNNTIINTSFNVGNGNYAFTLTNLSVLGANRDYSSITWYVTSLDLVNNFTTTSNTLTTSIDIIPYASTITYLTNITQVNDSSNFSMQLQYNYTNNTIIQNAVCDLQFPQRTANGIFDNLLGIFNFSLAHWFGLQPVTANCSQINSSSASLIQNINVTDKTKPLITILNGTNATENNAINFTFAFSIIDNSSISGNLTINGTTYPYNTITKQIIANLTGDFTYSWNLSIIDTNGNRNTTPNYLFIHDTTAPIINTWAVPSTATASTAFTISANVTDANTISSVTAKITQPNSVILPITLIPDLTIAGYTHSAVVTLTQAGINTLTEFNATDLAGNNNVNSSLNIGINVGGGGGSGGTPTGAGGGGGTTTIIQQAITNQTFTAMPNQIANYCFWAIDSETERKCTTTVHTNQETKNCNIKNNELTSCNITSLDTVDLISTPKDKTTFSYNIDTQIELTSTTGQTAIINLSYHVFTYTNFMLYTAYTIIGITIITALFYVRNKKQNRNQNIITIIKSTIKPKP